MVVLAVAAASVFAASTVGKTRSRRSFAAYLRPVTGHATAGLVVAILSIEGTLAVAFGASLVAPGILRATAGVAAGFVLAATIGYVTLLIAGQSAACNCFGVAADDEPVDPAVRPALLAVRNTCLICVCLVLAGSESPLVLAGACLVAFAVAGGLVASTVSERRQLRSPRHPVWYANAQNAPLLEAHGWWVNGHAREV